ncbi:amidohydrolase [Shewanella olleyana]|uniref:amidohydrolase n=1 Tax=Shewanella olleyana TaxID=135626 RepID=UPI00200F4AEB|nr:amidohydrolase [Shewanella olleyana]MCL1066703.1 amidohydrolase [Shewanella olleyana]
MTNKKVTVFTAKKVLTMDPGRPEVEAVAVLDGKVLSTGTIDSMSPWLAQYDWEVDNSFENKVIMPGFIEPHSHCWMSSGFMSLNFIGPLAWPGRNGMNKPLKNCEEILDFLRKADKEEKDPTAPLIAWGYDEAKQGGGVLERDVLDKISSTRPIYLISWAPHLIYMNTPAIELSNIPQHSNDPHIKFYEDGRLKGIVTEPEACSHALIPIMQTISEASGVPGLKFMADIANRAGVTTIADLMFGVIDFDIELADHQAATQDAEFPVRIRLTPYAAALNAKFGDAGPQYMDTLKKNETDDLCFGGIKFMSDGSYPLMGSLVGFPGYLDGSNGQPGDSNLAKIMKPYWDAGLQLHCHANGDFAIDLTLDALAELQAKHPRFDHRFTVEHYAMSNQMQARRLKSLGGIASVNNYFSHFRSLLHRDHAYGPDRSETVARLGTLEREGVTFALHSDYPQVVVPMLPLTAVYAAVNRVAEDGETVVAPDECIGVERALRAVTIDAAYILGLETTLGSIEQGKFADFTVLDENPLEVESKSIKDIPIWGTVKGGVKFEAKD